MREYSRDAKYFVRNRILTFQILILFLVNLIKSSIQTELNGFFKAIFRFDVAKTLVTKSAFCQARKKT